MDSKTNLRTIGASCASNEEREENDFYATDPNAVQLLLYKENFNKSILEPCCGQGHISETLKNYGYNVISSDIINRGYGFQFDFF